MDRTAATVPGFADALREEAEHLAFCREMRSDLKRLRKSMGVTQRELAARMEMSQSAVSRIENAGGDLGLTTLRRYAGALGMQPVMCFTLSSQSCSRPEAIEPIMHAMENLARIRDAEAREMLTGARAGRIAASLRPPKDQTKRLKCRIAHQASPWLSIRLPTVYSDT